MNLKKFVADQIKDKLISIVLEILMIVIVCGFTLYKINDNYNATKSIIIQQGAKIDILTAEVTSLTKLFCETAGMPLKDFQENRSEIYGNIQDALKNKLNKKSTPKNDTSPIQ